MVRTIVSLPEEDKAWLDRVSDEEGVPMTALVRRAVALLRRQAETGARDFGALLEATIGLWDCGDAVAYQEALRRER